MTRDPRAVLVLVLLGVAAFAPVVSAQTTQEKEASRIATRERLNQLLTTAGPKKGIELSFKRSDKNPFNFVVIKKGGMKNAESMEIVVGVSEDETIGFRIYPYYSGSYVNIDKVKNGAGLMRKLLNLSDHNFLYWGADDSGDIFAGFTVTLESGFPEKALETVLYSIVPLDQYVGELRPMIDGSIAVK